MDNNTELETKPETKAGFLKKMVYGMLGLGGATLLYKNNKAVEKENLQHKIEMVELQKKLPFHERYKWTTRIAVIATLGSMYRCKNEYRDLGNAVLEAFRETRQTAALKVEQTKIETKLKNQEWEQKYNQKISETKQEKSKRIKLETELAKTKAHLEEKTNLLYETKTELEEKNIKLYEAKIASRKKQNNPIQKNSFQKRNNSEPETKRMSFSQKNVEKENYSVIVKPGDTLWKIADRTYKKVIINKTICEKLANYNNLNDMNKIKVNQIIELPKNHRVLYK